METIPIPGTQKWNSALGFTIGITKNYIYPWETQSIK